VDKKELAKQRKVRKEKRALLRNLLASGADRMVGLDRNKHVKPDVNSLINEPVGFTQVYGQRLREFIAVNPKLSDSSKEAISTSIRVCAEELLGLTSIFTD
jgi:hypothetical protein